MKSIGITLSHSTKTDQKSILNHRKLKFLNSRVMTLHVLLKIENRKLNEVKDTSGLMALVVLPILSKSKMMSFMAKSSFSWIIRKRQVNYTSMNSILKL